MSSSWLLVLVLFTSNGEMRAASRTYETREECSSELIFIPMELKTLAPTLLTRVRGECLPVEGRDVDALAQEVAVRLVGSGDD